MKLIRRIGPLRMQAIKIALLGGTFWFAWAYACYQSVYLQEKGFQASDIGVLNAISAGVNILSVSFWGTVSDRIGSLKRVLFSVLLGGSLLYSLVPAIPTDIAFSHLLLLAILPSFNFFRGSMTTMVENMQVRNCNELRLNYGFIRSFGSLMFTFGSLSAAGLLAGTIEVRHTFVISFLLMLIPITLTIFVRDPKLGRLKNMNADPNQKKEKISLKPLFQNKTYIFFLIFAFIFYIAANCEATFIPYYMKSIDVNPQQYGVILAYRAMLEIPFLLLMARLRRRFSLQQLFLFGVTLMSLECLCLGTIANSLFTMILSTTFFGLGNGLFIGSSLNYLYHLAPDRLKASAQAFFAAIASVAGIAGNLIGGALFDNIGAKPFYLVVFLLMMISVIVFAVFVLINNKKKKALPSDS